MTDIQKDFAKHLDIGAVRVKNVPNFVFLCGGPVHHDKNGYRSVRHYVYDQIASKRSDIFERIVLAERVIQWYHSGLYQDLLTLETDLAGLSAAIVLIVESPGSIAELGSFVLSPEISERLVVFLNSDHSQSQSFISEGPIGYFESRHPEYIFRYPWGWDAGSGCVDEGSIEPYVEEILESINLRMNEQPKEKKFDAGKSAHRILLLADLIYMYEIVRFNEILSAFQCIIVDSTESELKKFLNILKSLNIIRVQEVGRDR